MRKNQAEAFWNNWLRRKALYYRRRDAGTRDRTNAAYPASPADLYEWLSRHGKGMECAPLTFVEAKYVVQLALELGPSKRAQSKHKRKRRRHPGFAWIRVKGCFINTLQLVAADDRQQLVYCEGYVRDGSFAPIAHAWATIGGKVVDLTLRTADRKSGHRPSKRNYYGVEFPRELFSRLVDRTHSSGPWMEDPRNWPELEQICCPEVGPGCADTRPV